MKNKIKFSENDGIQEKQFINQKKAGSICDSNLYSTEEQKRTKKFAFKVIKGKVKVYHNNNKPKLIDDKYIDDESELMLVSDRMLHFLKFATLLFAIIFLFILLKKYS